VIGLDDVVRILVEDMPRGWRKVGKDTRIDRCSVGGDLGRSRSVSQRAREECPCCRGVTALGDQDVDDLAVLADRAVERGPAAGDIDVGLVDEPPVTRGVTSWPGGVDELGRSAPSGRP
jgi:hypothetical protein